jgi:circadian clock protein KaiC
MKRVKTGITGLDEMLHGGLLKSDATLVAGSAGAGKTTLALQFLFNGATQFGENGVYVTFEQLPQQIYRDAKNFGWDIQRLEKENKIKVVCTSPDLLLKGLGKGLIDGPIQETGAKRIVIDSLSHLQTFVIESKFRKEAYRLINYLKIKGLTSMLTQEVHEVVGTALSITGMGISFLVDCTILLRFVEIESAMRKALVILKIRGSDHDKHLREFEITATGIKVASPFEKYENILTGSPRKSSEEKFVDVFAEIAGKRRGG